MIRRIYGKIGIMLRAARIRVLALTLGSEFSLGATVYIHQGGRILLGRGVRVAKGCVITVLPDAVLELKDGCILNHGAVVYCANEITIGRNSRIAHYCSLIDHDYDFRNQGSTFEASKISSPIMLGDEVWLGANVVVLKGVTIGSKSVVGAHTLVNKSIPEGSLAYCPANSQLVIRCIDRNEQ